MWLCTGWFTTSTYKFYPSIPLFTIEHFTQGFLDDWTRAKLTNEASLAKAHFYPAFTTDGQMISGTNPVQNSEAIRITRQQIPLFVLHTSTFKLVLAAWTYSRFTDPTNHSQKREYCVKCLNVRGAKYTTCFREASSGIPELDFAGKFVLNSFTGQFCKTGRAWSQPSILKMEKKWIYMRHPFERINERADGDQAMTREQRERWAGSGVFGTFWKKWIWAWCWEQSKRSLGRFRRQRRVGIIRAVDRMLGERISLTWSGTLLRCSSTCATCAWHYCSWCWTALYTNSTCMIL